jgi:undecaprenyl-diphosphatase
VPIPLLHAIVLGAVQGLTEFFPISSSGHLILVPWLFGWTLTADPDLNKSFDVALHLGTFVGAAAYFFPDLRRLGAAAARSLRARAVRDDDERTAWLLCLSAIPGAAVGALLEGFIQDELGRVWLIAVLLIGFGLLLAVADRMRGDRAAGDFRLRDALVMGFAQAAALSPGVSRSGVTITAGRWLGFGRDAATRLSFLMSLPIIGGAGVYKGLDVVAGGGLPPGVAGAFVWGMLTSGVTGALAVWATLRLVRTRSFTPFVVYRVVAGLAVLGLVASGVR